jgi:TPR repeat protein
MELRLQNLPIFDNPERSIIPWPSHELIAAPTGGSRILTEIVKTSLALVKEIAPATVDLDSLVREGKRIQRRKGMTPEDIHAYDLFYRAAASDHAEAKYHLADCYFHGFGIQKHPATALEWLKNSAESAFPPAQFLLGKYYEIGVGVPVDFDESEKWYRRAAEAGNADAQCEIGEFYRDGVRDYNEAAKWYRMAAEQGNADAQYELGLYFSGGDRNRSLVSGTPDRRFMREFFSERLAHALENLLLGEKFPFDVLNAWTGETIIPANCKITRTLIRRLVNDYAPADIYPPMLAGKIQKIMGVLKREAAKWFRNAAEKGQSDAQISLAICYQCGDGVEADPLQAYAWFQLAADAKADLAEWSRANLGFVLTADEEATEAKKAATLAAATLSQSDLENAQRLYREFKRKYSAKQ